MLGAEALRESAKNLVVGAALARRVDELRPDLEMLVAAAGIEIVVLHEHGRGQHDIGHERRLGHELLVHADEEILAGKTPFHELLLRRDGDRVGVLDQHRLDRRPVVERLGVAGENAADLRLVENADAFVDGVMAFDQRLVPVEDAAVGMKRAAALVSPCTCHRRN